jgi:hypothetical protein
MAIRYEEPKKVIEPMFFVNPDTLVDSEVEMAFHEAMKEVAKGEMDKAEIAVALKAVVDMASEKFAKEEAVENEGENNPKQPKSPEDDTYVKP